MNSRNEKSIQSLRQSWSSDDLKALKAYWEFNDRFSLEISEKLNNALSDHPVIGPIIKNRSEEERLEEDEFSRRIQRNAIFNGDWKVYTEHLMAQGIAYAHLGLEMGDWFYIVKMYRDECLPYLETKFKTDWEGYKLVKKGINLIIDFALLVISEAYSQEKLKLLDKEKSEKKSVQSKLDETTERFKLAMEGSSAGIWDWNIKTNEVYFSPRFKEMLGYPENEFPNEYSSWEKALHPQEKEEALKEVNDSLYSDKPFDLHYRLKTKSNEFITVLSRGKVLKDEEGNPYRMAGSISDISRLISTEKELKELNENLEDLIEERTASLKAANEELESFSYTVSHDLRAPLRAISGFAQILETSMTDSDETQLRYLGYIIENVGKMGELIDDLLAFSRMGKKSKHIVKFDFKELAQEVFRDQASVRKKNNTKFIVQKLPVVYGDREMMKHVMANLLGNALKFTEPKNEPEIEIGSERKGDYYQIYVKDNGVGFDMRHVDKLFGIFQRLHSEEEFEGTGVGLAIVQRIVRRHEGAVWAESEEGKGATFYLSLPANGIELNKNEND